MFFLPFLSLKSHMGPGRSPSQRVIKDLHRAPRCDCWSGSLDRLFSGQLQAALKCLAVLKWLECFLSVFSVEGTAEKCGFSRPL